MTGESWHEERDRLNQLPKGIESGTITHVDEDDLRQLQALSPRNVELFRERLAELEVRLGPGRT